MLPCCIFKNKWVQAILPTSLYLSIETGVLSNLWTHYSTRKGADPAAEKKEEKANDEGKESVPSDSEQKTDPVTTLSAVYKVQSR